MNGVEALQALQQGKRVRRPNWEDEEYIYAKVDEETGRWELYNERDDVEDCFIDIRDFLDPKIDDWEVVYGWIYKGNEVVCRFCEHGYKGIDNWILTSFNYCPNCGHSMR